MTRNTELLTNSVAKDRNLAFRQKRKAMALELLGGMCEECGTTDNLEFHHIDPRTKEFNLGNSWTKAWTRVLDELDKCYLICYDCHKDEHEAEHGTWSRYTNRSCRCPKCMDAMRKWDKKRKAKLKWREEIHKIQDRLIVVEQGQSSLNSLSREKESLSAKSVVGPLILTFPSDEAIT